MQAHPSPDRATKTLVLGIGNTLLTDEGIGVHVVEALRPQFSGDSGVELLDGGTLSFTLAVPIQAADALIVIDAANLEAAPGSLQTYSGEAMDLFLATNRRPSVHEVGLADLMTIAKLGGHWPARRVLVAIQPGSMGWGEAPSVAVAMAIPEACKQVRALIEEWRHAV